MYGVTSFDSCYQQVVTHYRMNKLDAPSGLRDKIMDFCCRHTEKGRCLEGITLEPDGQSPPNDHIGTVEQLMRGTQAIVSWFQDGKATEELAEARAQSCLSGNHGSKCQYNKTVSCPPCKRRALDRIKTLVTRVLQGDEVEWENGLNYCTLCGCSLRLKVRTKIDVLAKQIKKREKDALPEFCWLRKELDNYGGTEG